MFDAPPSNLEEEEVSGVSCIKATFENVVLRKEKPGESARVVAWLDGAIGSLPRRIRVEANDRAKTFTDFEVTEFQEIPTAGGSKLILPLACLAIQTTSTEEVRFSEITVAVSLPDHHFEIPPVHGTRILDESSGEKQVRYIGGADGEREHMRLAGVSDTVIRAVVDKDPEAFRTLHETLPVLASASNGSNLKGPLAESGPGFSTMLLIASGVLGASILILKYQRLRR